MTTLTSLILLIHLGIAGSPDVTAVEPVRVEADTLSREPAVPVADTLSREPAVPEADTLSREPVVPVADTLSREPAMPEADTLPRPPDLPPDQLPADDDDPATLPVDDPERLEQEITDERDPVRRFDPVDPLTMRDPVAFQQVSNDSLSRWQLWSDQGEWVSRQPGVISAQLGGLGRNDGFLIRGHDSRHQRLWREGIPMNERIFGSANRKRLPHYSRIATVHENTAPLRYHSEFQTVRYHVARPLTFINYEQTSFEYRSTEGFLARNITPSTNISMAYWGKNEGQSYRNRTMGGRNAEVTLYHFLTDSWMVEGGVHYSGIQLGEPESYRPYDMFNFLFNRFEAVPDQPQGRSSMRNSLFRVTAYHRTGPDREATTRVSLYHDRYRRSHYDNADSAFVRTLTTGVAGRHHLLIGPIELQGDIYSEWSVIDQDRFETMDIDSWVYTEARGTLSLPLPNRSRLYGWMQSGWRTDGHADAEIGAGIDWRLFYGLSLYGSYAFGEQMPRPGHLYRTRSAISGSEGLSNETIHRGAAGIRLDTPSWNAGAEMHASHHRNPIMVGADSVFVQPGPYLAAGATAWLGYDGNRLEFSLSGTFLQYFADGAGTESQLLDRSGQRMWTRASIYYKNYVFNQAAFLKTGFYVQASPTLYRSSQYYPAMDYWDPNSWHPSPDITEAQPLPEFVRLDFDLTARVRSAIFLLRMENALDNWLLPGYFETAWQPMPSNRLRFGIRWVLRN